MRIKCYRNRPSLSIEVKKKKKKLNRVCHLKRIGHTKCLIASLRLLYLASYSGNTFFPKNMK